MNLGPRHLGDQGPGPAVRGSRGQFLLVIVQRGQGGQGDVACFVRDLYTKTLDIRIPEAPGATKVQALMKNTKRSSHGGGPHCDVKFGELPILKQTWPEWPYTKQVSHGRPVHRPNGPKRFVQLSFGGPKGPKRKLAVVPPYTRGELFRCQPSVCAPATEVATGPIFRSLFWGRPRFELQG